MSRLFITFAAALAVPTAALAQHDHGGARTEAPPEARVYFITPADGDTVANPVTFHFGLQGMGIAPAGVDWPDTGHHHMFINTDPATMDMDATLPATENILHFGGGQTEVTLDLPAGEHTFWLLLGDTNHVPHDPPVMSEPITLTIE
ncbi:DUF4399 domain-containing protein [Rhodobaculum claviforme]|uniref:Rod shape-determining protein RodA n=1 Tax=Rhodobaculum claviforme TaxID=1549854 RepID=A0A934TJI3_9RHOB|nr:DUF4399 domain-containing protein [Rhodobaculum claviforme]MBK5926367.1 rod shape-determining protein RodA [Rhodobaculum claviforme]